MVSERFELDEDDIAEGSLGRGLRGGGPAEDESEGDGVGRWAGGAGDFAGVG